MEFVIRERRGEDDAWVVEVLSRAWGSPAVVARGWVHRADRLPGLVAESAGESTTGSTVERAAERIGLLTYEVRAAEMEVVSLQALLTRSGVGSALVAAARGIAERAGLRRLWLVTTNDNLEARAFYARVGMRHVATHRGAAARARLVKPEIPEFGASGIRIEDELEFEYCFGGPAGGPADRAPRGNP